jgi:hypothetical protein
MSGDMKCFPAMTGILELWLPLLVSSVIVYVASSIIHMALPWHKSDYPKIPNEEKVMDSLRPLAIPPGDYMVPRPASYKDMGKPEFMDKLKQGPVMMVTVLPNGATSMGKNLAMWFLYIIVVGFFAAYIAGRALHHGESYLNVFRLVGPTAFIGYSLALWQMSIWFRRGWSLTIKSTIDGLVYAGLTAGTFGWLWPK